MWAFNRLECPFILAIQVIQGLCSTGWAGHLLIILQLLFAKISLIKIATDNSQCIGVGRFITRNYSTKIFNGCIYVSSRVSTQPSAPLGPTMVARKYVYKCTCTCTYTYMYMCNCVLCGVLCSCGEFPFKFLHVCVYKSL